MEKNAVCYERHEGRIPCGGDYSEIFYMDDHGNATDASTTTLCMIRECKADGTMIMETTQISDQYEQYDGDCSPKIMYSKVVPAELSQLELPDYSEGFDELYYVEIMGSYHRDGDTNAMVKSDWADIVQTGQRNSFT